MKAVSWFCVVVALVLLQKCNFPQPGGGEASSWLQVDSFSLKLPQGQGVPTKNITDVWVFSNGILVGCFALPAKIPIRAEGPTRISAYAGSFANGMRSYRIEYPFYSGVDDTIFNMKPGSLHILNPEIAYRDKIQFPYRFSEDFEFSTTGWDSAAFSNVPFKTLSASEANCSKCGDRVGYLEAPIASNQLVMGMITKDKIDVRRLPGQRPAYLEFDYKTSLETRMGCYLFNVDGAYLGVTNDLVLNDSKGQWRKMYYLLNNDINRFPNVSSIQIYFACPSDGKEKEEFMIDNIRLINFKDE